MVDITAKGTSSGNGQSTTPFGGAPQQSQTKATGTGFVVDGKGNIVTAAHVVDGASSLTVKFAGGTTRRATVVGKDDATDKAGLEAGDVVTKLAGSTVKDSSDLVAAIAEHRPGDQVKVILRRGSSTVERTVTLGTQPAQSSSTG